MGTFYHVLISPKPFMYVQHYDVIHESNDMVHQWRFLINRFVLYMELFFNNFAVVENLKKI